MKCIIAFRINGAEYLGSSRWRFCQLSCSFTKPRNWPERSILQFAFSEISGNTGNRGRYQLRFWWYRWLWLNGIPRILRQIWSESARKELGWRLVREPPHTYLKLHFRILFHRDSHHLPLHSLTPKDVRPRFLTFSLLSFSLQSNSSVSKIIHPSCQTSAIVFLTDLLVCTPTLFPLQYISARVASLL